MLASSPSSSSASASASSSLRLSFGVRNSEVAKTIKNTARNANCAQKARAPKNGKFNVTRLRKVETKLGVQTFFDTFSSDNSEQALMRFLWFEQSG